MSTRNFWGLQNLEEKSNWNRFRPLGTNIRKVGQNFSAEPSELLSTFPDDEFQGKTSLKKCVSSVFPDFAQKFLEFLKRVLSEISKCVFYMLKRTFWDKHLCWNPGFTFSDFKQKMCGFIAKNFRVGCQILILSVQTFLWRNVIIETTINFFFVGCEQKLFLLLRKCFGWNA